MATNLQEVLKSPVEAKENTVAKAKEVLKTVDFSKAELADQLAKMEISLEDGKKAKLIDVVAAIDEENYAAGESMQRISSKNLEFKLDGKKYSIGWASEAGAWIQTFLTAKGVGKRLGKSGIDGKIGTNTIHAIDEYMQREKNKIVDETKKELEETKKKLVEGKKANWKEQAKNEAEGKDTPIEIIMNELDDIIFDAEFVNTFSFVKNRYGFDLINPKSHRLDLKQKKAIELNLEKGIMIINLSTKHLKSKDYKFKLDDFVVVDSDTKVVKLQEDKFVEVLTKKLEEIQKADLEALKQKQAAEAREKGLKAIELYLSVYSKHWKEIPAIKNAVGKSVAKRQQLGENFDDGKITLDAFSRTAKNEVLFSFKNPKKLGLSENYFNGDVADRTVPFNVWDGKVLRKSKIDQIIENAILKGLE